MIWDVERSTYAHELRRDVWLGIGRIEARDLASALQELKVRLEGGWQGGQLRLLPAGTAVPITAGVDERRVVKRNVSLAVIENEEAGR